MTEIIKVREGNDPNSSLGLVFVHGLGGDARGTWTSRAESAFWPEWICDEINFADIFTVQYDAPMTRWNSEGIGFQDRALSLLAAIESSELNGKRIIFFAHSLGGIIVKQMIRAADGYGNKDWVKICSNFRGILFFSTPHTGAEIVDTIDRLRTIIRPSIPTIDLRNESGALRDLNFWFRNNVGRLGISLRVYFETKDTSGVRVVSASSADPGISNVFPIPIDQNHVNICKIESRSDFLFKDIVKFCFSLKSSASCSQIKPASTLSSRHLPTTSHRRQFPGFAVEILDSTINEFARSHQLNSSAEFQASLAENIRIFLDRKYNIKLGPGCSAWTEHDSLFVSFLPIPYTPQATYEFAFLPSSLELKFVWEPIRNEMMSIENSEWHHYLDGLKSDRIPKNMDREVVIHILNSKQAKLSFPVSPNLSGPEALCGWEYDSNYVEDLYEWSRDPRLIEAGIACQNSAYHRPSETALFSMCLQGRWSPSAFNTLNKSLTFYLKNRYTIRVIKYGAILLTFFLGSRCGSPQTAKQVIKRRDSVLLRTIGSLRDYRIGPLEDKFAMSPVNKDEYESYKSAVLSLGDRYYPPLADSAAAAFATADWVKLRQSLSGFGYGEYGQMDCPLFGYPLNLLEEEVLDTIYQLENGNR